MRIKQIALFVALSLALQIIIFTVLEYKADQFLNPSFRVDQAYTLKSDLSEAHNFYLSYNNRYLSFIKGEGLQIMDLVNNTIVFESNSPLDTACVLGLKWLPDRNSIIYVSQDGSNAKREVSLFSLNLDNEALQGDSRPKPRLERIISLPMREIKAIETSTYTNNLYILFEDEFQNTRLITIDIMKNINRLDDPQETVLAIAVSNKFGTVYMESIAETQKYVSSLLGRERNVITDTSQDILLGCRDELLFIGRLEGDFLREIRLYSQESEEIKLTKVLWQGNISYDQPQVIIGFDNSVILQEQEWLAVIYPDGGSKFKTTKNRVVLSPASKMYLEIALADSKYYWRSL